MDVARELHENINSHRTENLLSLKTSEAYNKNKSLDPTVKNKLSPLLKTGALETVENNPILQQTKCTQDGSASRTTKFAGYRVLMKYPDGSR